MSQSGSEIGKDNAPEGFSKLLGTEQATQIFHCWL